MPTLRPPRPGTGLRKRRSSPSPSGKALVERGAPAVAALAERPQVGPRQPQVGVRLDRLDVVDLLGTASAARGAAEGVPLDEDVPELAPILVIALCCPARPALVEACLSPALG